MQDTIVKLSQQLQIYLPALTIIFTPLITFVTQKLKKWLSVQKTWKIQVLNFIVSIAFSGLQYIVSQGEQGLAFAGGLATFLFVTSTFLYSGPGKWALELSADAKKTREQKALAEAAGAPPIDATPVQAHVYND